MLAGLHVAPRRWPLRWAAFCVAALVVFALAWVVTHAVRIEVEAAHGKSIAVLRRDLGPVMLSLLLYGPALLACLVCLWPFRVVAALGWSGRIGLWSALQLWVLASVLFLFLITGDELRHAHRTAGILWFLGIAFTAGFGVYAMFVSWEKRGASHPDGATWSPLARWFGFLAASVLLAVASLWAANVLWVLIGIAGGPYLQATLFDVRTGDIVPAWYSAALNGAVMMAGALPFLWPFRLVVGLGWRARPDWRDVLMLWAASGVLCAIVWWLLFRGFATPMEAGAVFLATVATLGFATLVAMQTLAMGRQRRRVAAIFD